MVRDGRYSCLPNQVCHQGHMAYLSGLLDQEVGGAHASQPKHIDTGGLDAWTMAAERQAPVLTYTKQLNLSKSSSGACRLIHDPTPPSIPRACSLLLPKHGALLPMLPPPPRSA